MKFYIATSLSNMQSHNIVRDGFLKDEHTITYDWTLHGNVKCVSKERLQEVAVKELEGIFNADVLIVLLPGGFGTHAELGFGIASKKQVFLHSEDPSLFELGQQTNAFYHHPEINQLTCKLEDVASTVNFSLLETSQRRHHF